MAFSGRAFPLGAVPLPLPGPLAFMEAFGYRDVASQGPRSMRHGAIPASWERRHVWPRPASRAWSRDSTSQRHGAQQRVDLPQRVPLPLFGRAVAQRMRVFDECLTQVGPWPSKVSNFSAMCRKPRSPLSQFSCKLIGISPICGMRLVRCTPSPHRALNRYREFKL